MILTSNSYLYMKISILTSLHKKKKALNLIENYIYYQKNIRKTSDTNINLLSSLNEITNFNNISNNYSINSFESNFYYKFNKILYFLIGNHSKNWHLIGRAPDFKNTLEIILFIHLNNYFPKISNRYITNYSILQLQRIRNKAMQLNWMGRNSMHNKIFFNFNNEYYIKNLKMFALKGIKFGVKGRAADYRWVKLRYYRKLPLSFKHNPHLYRNTFFQDFFTTKWGSTNIRCQITYKKNQQN